MPYDAQTNVAEQFAAPNALRSHVRCSPPPFQQRSSLLRVSVSFEPLGDSRTCSQ